LDSITYVCTDTIVAANKSVFLIGVEKLNDDCRRVHLMRSNKWDAPKDVLLVEKRLEHLAEYERIPRKYNKRNEAYWNKNIRSSRAKRIRICTECPEEILQLGENTVENMTAEEIKVMLKRKGISTRLRSLKKLQELLYKTLRDEQFQTGQLA
jgi:hypothetical protein